MAIRFSREQRMLYARAVLIKQDKIAVKHRGKIAKEISNTVKEMAKVYADYGDLKMVQIAEEHKARLKPLLKNMASEAGRAFIMVPLDGLKGLKAANPQDEDRTWLADQIISDLESTAEDDADGIGDTTLNQARSVIADGIDEGLTQDEITRNIVSSLGGLTSRARAATISRTEVHTAANTAQHEMAQAMGLKSTREWIATNDDRVRDAHSEADGQVVDADQPFEVGGEELMYPGDPGGSPENVINCRCCIGYNVDLDSIAADDSED